MIRFVDLSACYWAAPECNAQGPFAFLDTVTDRFVVLGTEQIFFGRGDFEEAVEQDARRHDDPGQLAKLADRCRALIPPGF